MDVFRDAPDILEVTLRDGSYLIDFQFTAQDTATIAAVLESAGFRWIEIGHGLGLGASRAGKGEAAAADEEYLAAAAGALRTARWGMFCIPGIATLDDLRKAADHGMSFVRIGTDVTRIEQARPFLEQAGKLGMLASYNAMKSYAVSAKDFGRRTAAARDWGAHIVCLVDSAGGMTPDDVTDYLQAARERCDGPLGFHGHDNLSLAVANSLRAIELGAALVDTSLLGMGRSAGNARSEVLAAVLKKRGQVPHIDLMATMDAGLGLIQPLMLNRGMDPLAVASGYACFHSSFTPKVRQHAERHGVDPRDLIVRLCEVDQVNAPDELLERLARELAESRAPRTVSVPAFGSSRRAPRGGLEALRELLRHLRVSATKAGRFSTLNVVQSHRPLVQPMVSGNVQTTFAHAIGSAAVWGEAQLRQVLAAANGVVHVVFLDIDRHGVEGAASSGGAVISAGPVFAPEAVARECLERSELLTYSDRRAWIDALEEQIARECDELLRDVPCVLAGGNAALRRLGRRLAERGADVTLLDDRKSEPMGDASMRTIKEDDSQAGERLARARLIVVWTDGDPWFGRREIERVSAGTLLIDAGVKSISPDALELARQRKARLVRVNIWPALGAAVARAHESSRIRRDAAGEGSLAGVAVVAGGVIGRRGDVVVDSVRKPTRVIGVADGLGGVIFDYDDGAGESVRRVSQEIHRRLLASAV